MRALLAAVCMFAMATTARADELSTAMPTVRSDGTKAVGYISLVLGQISSDLDDDNHGRGQSENSGGAIGVNIRGEGTSLVTGYGGRFGGALELDALVVGGGVISGPQQPRASRVFLGVTPALLLGLVKTRSFSLAAELGTPINTDFYGLSAGIVLDWKFFYLGYRFRSGKAWRDTEVLDERVRVGIRRTKNDGITARGFFGIEVIDGYSEDDMGRADLGTMFRGSYTMISLVVGKAN
jgi:hypothetical protein